MSDSDDSEFRERRRRQPGIGSSLALPLDSSEEDERVGKSTLDDSDSEYDEDTGRKVQSRELLPKERKKRKLSSAKFIEAAEVQDLLDDSDDDENDVEYESEGQTEVYSGKARGGKRGYASELRAPHFVSAGVYQPGNVGQQAESSSTSSQTSDSSSSESANADLSADRKMATDSDAKKEQLPRAEDSKTTQTAPSIPLISKPSMPTNVAPWERYTTGIGTYLLAKMGFRGRLGKKEQGIDAPLEIHLRPTRIGIGGKGFDERAHRKKGSLKSKEPNELELKRPPSWKQRKTFDVETLQKKLEQEERMLAIAHNQDTKAAQERERYEKRLDALMPIHQTSDFVDHIQLLMRESVCQAKKLRKAIQEEKNRLAKVKEELKTLQETTAEAKRDISYYTALQALIPDMRDAPDLATFLAKYSKVDSLSELASHRFQQGHRLGIHDSTMTKIDLDGLADSLIVPLIDRHFDMILTTSSPNDDIDSAIMQLLPLCEAFGGLNSARWNRMLAQVFIPKMQTVVSVGRSLELCAHRLDALLPVLSDIIIDLLCDSVLLPRLASDISSWDPLRSSVPIHSTLFVWLPIVGKSKLGELFDIFSQRIGPLLARWRPHDPSAKAIIMPWKNVAPSVKFKLFLAKTIIPVMKEYLIKRLVVGDPTDPCPELDQVLDWVGVISDQSLGHVFLEAFFPKWIDALLNQLQANSKISLMESSEAGSMSHSNKSSAVSKWYAAWKGRIPSQICETDPVKVGFLAGLDAINMFMDEGGSLHRISAKALLDTRSGMLDEAWKLHQVKASFQASGKKPSTLLLRAAAEGSNTNSSNMFTALHADDERVESVRDMIQEYAESLSVTFLPSDRRVDGNKVYLLGGIPIYIDSKKNRIMAQVGAAARNVDKAKGSTGQVPQMIPERTTFQPVTMKQLRSYVQKQ